MPTLAVIGSQWGDEGKGKITDYLAEDADLVVRYQGGANAGHTIKVGDEVIALHLLPSGIIREGVLSVIGNGLVIDCEELKKELEMLRRTGRSGKCYGSPTEPMSFCHTIVCWMGLRSGLEGLRE